MKRGKLIIALAIILSFTVAGVAVTWAWIEQNNAADIKGTDIKLDTAPGLIIKLNGDETNVIDLNAYLLNNNPNFVLAEASSFNGTDLFIRQAGPTSGTPTAGAIYLHPADESTEKNNKYLEFEFTMQLESSASYTMPVWFDSTPVNGVPTTHIVSKTGTSVDAAKVIRIAMTVTSDDASRYTTDNTWVFCNAVDQSSASSASKRTTAVKQIDITTGQMYDYEPYAGEPILYSFGQFYDDDLNKWIDINPGETLTIKVRMWLEGGDEECEDYFKNNPEHLISGGLLEVFIRFTTIGA